MLNKIKITVIVMASLTFILILFSDGEGTELDPTIRNAIVTAYMNGYADALELNTKNIQKLKTNKKLLRQKIMQAASNYILLVENMNK
jgi:hypothetical protein